MYYIKQKKGSILDHIEMVMFTLSLLESIKRVYDREPSGGKTT